MPLHIAAKQLGLYQKIALKLLIFGVIFAVTDQLTIHMSWVGYMKLWRETNSSSEGKVQLGSSPIPTSAMGFMAA